MVAYPKELTIKEGDYYQEKYIAPNQLNGYVINFTRHRNQLLVSQKEFAEKIGRAPSNCDYHYSFEYSLYNNQ